MVAGIASGRSSSSSASSSFFPLALGLRFSRPGGGGISLGPAAALLDWLRVVRPFGSSSAACASALRLPFPLSLTTASAALPVSFGPSAEVALFTILSKALLAVGSTTLAVLLSMPTVPSDGCGRVSSAGCKFHKPGDQVINKGTVYHRANR